MVEPDVLQVFHECLSQRLHLIFSLLVSFRQHLEELFRRDFLNRSFWLFPNQFQNLRRCRGRPLARRFFIKLEILEGCVRFAHIQQPLSPFFHFISIHNRPAFFATLSMMAEFLKKRYPVFFSISDTEVWYSCHLSLRSS